MRRLAIFLLLFAATGFASSDAAKNRAVEQQFVTVVQSFAKGEQQEGRKDALLKVLDGLQVYDWTGTIRQLDKNEAGDYAVALAIDDGIVLRTDALDAKDKHSTVVRAASPLCGPLGRMKVGQKVLFEGEFHRDKAKGSNQGGLAGNGSVTQPEFAFQLTKIRGQLPPKKSWKEIVDGTRAQILALHQAGGGKLNLLDFAKTMGFKVSADTATILKGRGELTFKATGANEGEFSNAGDAADIKCKIGQIEIPALLAGTYTCSADTASLQFAKDHTFIGKVAVITAPLEAVSADANKVMVKIGGVLGGALSRALPLE